jgi:hypothetical protein
MVIFHGYVSHNQMVKGGFHGDSTHHFMGIMLQRCPAGDFPFNCLPVADRVSVSQRCPWGAVGLGSSWFKKWKAWGYDGDMMGLLKFTDCVKWCCLMIFCRNAMTWMDFNQNFMRIAWDRQPTISWINKWINSSPPAWFSRVKLGTAESASRNSTRY